MRFPKLPSSIPSSSMALGSCETTARGDLMTMVALPTTSICERHQSGTGFIEIYLMLRFVTPDAEVADEDFSDDNNDSDGGDGR